jgi:phage tail-like protein
MALQDGDVSNAAQFGLEVDGIKIKQIAELSGLKMSQSVIELKHNTNDGKYINKKLPGRPESGEVTLTRGLTGDGSFDKWVKAARFGKMGDARKNAEITVYDFEGSALKRYKLTNCWPKSVEIGTLKAGDTNIITEKLTITYESAEPA